MKIHDKSKFWFLNDNGTKKEPKEGEVYFNIEWRISPKFPFLIKDYIVYVLKDDKWIEI